MKNNNSNKNDEKVLKELNELLPKELDISEKNRKLYKELLEKLLNRIEIIIEDNQPISKGTFSKFADIFRKYPDVFNAVGAIITKWISSTN